jgi:hypothetical protein
MLADAKYKATSATEVASGRAFIAAGDIYESYAFMGAAGTDKLYLLYPSTRDISADPLEGQPIETIMCNGKTVVAASVGIGGISRPNGFPTLASNLRMLFGTLSACPVAS